MTRGRARIINISLRMIVKVEAISTPIAILDSEESLSSATAGSTVSVSEREGTGMLGLLKICGHD
jgi:hypothetical protein